MEIIVIVLLILYTAYKDYIYYKEREKLEVKLMSRNVGEYVDTIASEKEENTPTEDNPYIPVEEASFDQILKSKDRL